MNLKQWGLFWAAALVVGAALFRAGVPLLPIVLGIGLAGMVNRMRGRSARVF